MKIKTRDLVTGGLLIALGVILPSLFHLSGINGTIFSPMHIPVLLGGFILGPGIGFFIGILTPILNFLINGMPPVPTLWLMIIELGLYGLSAGFLYKNLKINLIISLIASMIIGRLGGASGAYILANLFSIKVNGIMFLKTATIIAWPAIVIQLLLIPVLVKAYSRSFGEV